MYNDFDIILQEIKRQLTPAEFVEMLGVGFDVILDNERLLEKIEENVDFFKEELCLG